MRPENTAVNRTGPLPAGHVAAFFFMGFFYRRFPETSFFLPVRVGVHVEEAVDFVEPPVPAFWEGWQVDQWVEVFLGDFFPC
jgi:hypothetical protein